MVIRYGSEIIQILISCHPTQLIWIQMETLHFVVRILLVTL